MEVGKRPVPPQSEQNARRCLTAPPRQGSFPHFNKKPRPWFSTPGVVFLLAKNRELPTRCGAQSGGGGQLSTFSTVFSTPCVQTVWKTRPRPQKTAPLPVFSTLCRRKTPHFSARSGSFPPFPQPAKTKILPPPGVGVHYIWRGFPLFPPGFQQFGQSRWKGQGGKRCFSTFWAAAVANAPLCATIEKNAGRNRNETADHGL